MANPENLAKVKQGLGPGASGGLQIAYGIPQRFARAWIVYSVPDAEIWKGLKFVRCTDQIDILGFCRLD
jgi:hypothetical protein